MARGSACDVTVVVPVFNPGQFLEPCIDSLLSQTIGAENCQLVFVDDGSTDTTPARLDDLQRTRRNVVVRHEPPSGWSGRPRNVGLDLADGDFVFFCDQDDWLAPDGLEALVETARRVDADVVVGKMVGHRRRVPVDLFRTSRDDATVHNCDLMWSLTPHKLFRRSMLAAHGIRFPEGKRRLEDHPFVTAAYFAARRIAIVADRPIYHHIKRPDLGNAANTHVEPSAYFRYARETMDIVERHVAPGPDRDRLMWRFLRGQMLDRISEPALLRMPHDRLTDWYEQIRVIQRERYPDSALDRLAPVPRARAYAVRDDRLDVLHDIAARCAPVAADGRTRSVSTAGTGWRIEVDAALVDAERSPIGLVADGDGWRLPALIPDGWDGRTTPTSELVDCARARLTLRERDRWEEWIVPATVDVAMAGGPTGHQLRVSIDATIDATQVRGGGALPPGHWELWLSMRCHGLIRRSRLRHEPGAASVAQPVAYGDPGMVAELIGNDRTGAVRLRVAPAKRALAAITVRACEEPQHVRAGRLAVDLPIVVAGGTGLPRCWLELRLPDGSVLPATTAAIAPTGAGAARLTAEFPGDHARGGHGELWGRFAKQAEMVWLAVVTLD